MIAKMKSVCASGSSPHFSFEPPRPAPHQPPEASANFPCSACHPPSSGSRVGLSHVVMRSRRSALVCTITATTSSTGAPTPTNSRSGQPAT